MNTDFNHYLDGLLLSDGCISKSVWTKNYSYGQGCKYKEWLEDICFNFNLNGLRNKIYDVKPHTSGFGNKNTSYHLQSHSMLFFTEQHKRWYIKEYNYIDCYPKIRWHYDEKTEEWFVWHKTVPKDISLTSECVLNWFLGDGYIGHTSKNSYRIQLSTNGFTKKEVEYLVFLLNKHTTDCTHINKQKKHYTISISKKEGVKEFLDYIINLERPYCYNYKFPKVQTCIRII